MPTNVRCRVRVLAIVIAMVSTLHVFAPAASAAYIYDCQSTHKQRDQAVFERIKQDPGITGVRGSVVTVDLVPCTNPTSTVWDIPYVLTTLQLDPTGVDYWDIVQIGYAQCGRRNVDGYCNYDVPPDGLEHFVYTKDDFSGGVLQIADGWYGAAPQLGVRYQFRIRSTTSGSGAPEWEYCIRNEDNNQSFVCTTRSRTWGTNEAPFGWWGAETGRTDSQLGARSLSNTQMDMRVLYRRSGTWYWVDGHGVPDHGCVKENDVGTFPSRYQCAVSSIFDTNGDGSLNDSETLLAYTVP